MKKTHIEFITLLAILLLPLASVPTVFADDYETVQIGNPSKDWLYWNASSDSAAIVLYGGSVYNSTTVKVKAFVDENLTDRWFFITNLTASGYDVLTNDFLGYYNPSATWLTDAAEWLRNESYANVYVFGWSAGGMSVGYEIQRPGADQLFDAAVIADAPVNWSTCGAIYCTALNASNAKVRTSFICCEDDNCSEMTMPYPQMMLYYNNLNSSLDKAWHKWNGGYDYHDPFPDTCLTHEIETIGEAVCGWFSSETYNLTLSAIDPEWESMEVPVVIDDEYFVWSNETVTVYPGWHTVETAPAWNSLGFTHWMNPYLYNTTLLIWFEMNWQICAAYWDGASTNYSVTLNASDSESSPLYDVPILVDNEDVLYANDTYELYEGWHTLEAPETWDNSSDYYTFDQWLNDGLFYSYNNTILIDVQSTCNYTAVYEPIYYDFTIWAFNYSYDLLEMPVIVDDEYFIWTNNTYELTAGWHTLEVAPAWNGDGFLWWWYPYSTNTTLSINLQSDTEYYTWHGDYSATDTYDLALGAVIYVPGPLEIEIPILVDNSYNLTTLDVYELYEGWHTLEAPTLPAATFWAWECEIQGVFYTPEILIDFQSDEMIYAVYTYTG